MTKVLVERVTWYCARISKKEYGQPRIVRIVIGTRDGFYIDDFIDYLKDDQENQRTGKSTLRFHPDWRVLDWGEIVEAPAAGTPGLQLADILVGSFSQAVDKRRHRGCNPEYAKQFFHRMARNAKRRHAHFGVTIWPFPLTKGRRAPLDPDQEEILRFYGFDNEALGRPGPTSSAR
jgi:hypothetical protein